MKHSNDKPVLVACPSFRIGGWSTFALNLGHGLRAAGRSTSLLVTDPFGEAFDDLRAAYDNVTVVARGLERRNAYLARIVDAVRREQPSMLVNNADAFVQAALPFAPRETVTVSVLHTPHPAEVLLGVRNLESLDWVVPVAPVIAQQIPGTVSERKIRTIPPPVALRAIDPAAAHREVLRAVYVGRVTTQAKNLPVLERVVRIWASRRTACHLTVIGDGDYLPTMKANVARDGLGAHVTFLGGMPPRRVVERLPAFDVMLLTSIYEGAPNAVLEGMAAGVVPVVSRLPGATDFVVDDGVNGFLCESGRPEQFADAVERLIASRDLLARLRENAVRAIRDRFSRDRIVSELLSLVSLAEPTRLVMEAPVAVCADLRGNCHGLARHMRRLVGDVARRWQGVKRVRA